MSRLFDIDSVPMFCANCGEEVSSAYDLRAHDEQCAECYVNELCPAQCNDEHDAPEPDGGGHWQCETTDENFAYTGIDNARGFAVLSNWAPFTRWQDEHVLVLGWWYADYADAGLYWCEHCEDHVDEDHYHDDEDEDGGNCDDREPDEAPVCCARGCSSDEVTHFHLLTEKLYCVEHHTLMAVENRGLIPTLEMVAA